MRRVPIVAVVVIALSTAGLSGQALDRKKVPFAQFRTIDLSEAEHEHDESGEPLNVKGGLPSGSFNINLEELFLD